MCVTCCIVQLSSLVACSYHTRLSEGVAICQQTEYNAVHSYQRICKTLPACIQQVSRKLETLQRRKRRRCRAGETLPNARSAPDWLERAHLRPNGLEAEVDQPTDEQLPAPQRAGTADSEGFWMFQSCGSATTERQDSGVIVETDRVHSATEKSEGIPYFAHGLREDNVIHLHGPSLVVSPLRQRDAGLTGHAQGKRVDRDVSSRRVATSHRQWTLPASAPKREPLRSPLLRLLDGSMTSP